jgi:hypothetical protein
MKDCNFYQSLTYRAYSPGTDFWAVRVKGNDVVVENLTIESGLAGHTLKFDPNTRGGRALLHWDNINPESNNPVIDFGLNTINHKTTGTEINRYDTFSTGIVNQFINDSAQLSTAVTDGTTLAIGIGSLNADNVKGPHGDGYSYKVDFTGGNRCISWDHSATNTYTNNFSVWVLTDEELDIELYGASDFRDGYNIKPGIWTRVFMNYRSTVTAVTPFGIRGPVGKHIYMSAPQLTERAPGIGISGPEGYVRSGVFNLAPVRSESDPRLVKQRFGVGAPTAGQHEVGEVVYELTPATSAGDKYGNVCVLKGVPGSWLDLKTGS